MKAYPQVLPNEYIQGSPKAPKPECDFPFLVQVKDVCIKSSWIKLAWEQAYIFFLYYLFQDVFCRAIVSQIIHKALFELHKRAHVLLTFFPNLYHEKKYITLPFGDDGGQFMFPDPFSQLQNCSLFSELAENELYKIMILFLPL